MLVNDEFPLHLTANKALLCLQDLVAPFYRFINISYENSSQVKKTGLSVRSEQYMEIAGKKTPIMEATLCIDHDSLHTLSINLNGKHIKAQWSTEN
jgi:hypothetical protein